MHLARGAIGEMNNVRVDHRLDAGLSHIDASSLYWFYVEQRLYVRFAESDSEQSPFGHSPSAQFERVWP